MIWIVIVMIVVGYLIVRAINRSTETRARIDLYNGLSESDKAEYHQSLANVELQQRGQALNQAKTKFYQHIFHGKHATLWGHTDSGIATYPMTQRLAAQAGLVVKDAGVVRDIMRSKAFLEANDLLVPLRNMLDSGLTDEKIAKKLGRMDIQKNRYRYSPLYSPEDIHILKTRA